MFHVKQNRELIEIDRCPVCSGRALAPYLETKDFFYSQEAFTLSQCDKCSFVFTNPIPSVLSKYYETPDYLSHNSENKGVLGVIYSLIRKANIKRKYRLLSSYVSNGSLLDIGCGTGELLHFFAKKGWKTSGVEPNTSARKFAIKNYNLNVLDEDGLDILQSEYYDIISMWHVLEHVPDLHGRLSQVDRLLKKGGTLVVALPNLASPDSKKYLKYWSALDVPRHLYHFTQTTFNHLISKHNMKIINAVPMKFDSYYVSLLSEKYLKNPFFFLSAIYNGYLSNLRAKKTNNYSSMIFVIKRR